MRRCLICCAIVAAALLMPACSRKEEGEKLGKYTLLGIMTDGANAQKCKANVEDTLSRHPDVNCMIGLWAYNPPQMVAAVREAGKLGRIQLVGFDEEEPTLQAIRDGHMIGTVVQNPYVFGQEAVKMMHELAKGNRTVLPKDGMKIVPHRVITKANVDSFMAELKTLRDREPVLPPAPGPESERIKIAFVSNNPFEFWTFARKGTMDAVAKLRQEGVNIECDFYMPARGTAAEQQDYVTSLISRGFKAVAVSPNEARHQVEFFNSIADKIHVITVDSDLGNGTKRLCYIGTHNVEAGKAAGRLARKALGDKGGKIMIYVGKLDVQNAVDRSNGVKEALREEPYVEP